ncbi:MULTISPECIES: GAF domain-containing sensor histidine kinase [unclassified Rhizobium]|uniref:sensor histidine kinase n=1 Tax=unclassified Rhizobium TaxID=2613769 RepID=UPI00288A629F|nr:MULTISPECIES: GAF domain-containing sensor histidine kinase [unclassified Rhizobium]
MDQRTRPSTPLASLSKVWAKIARARTTEAAIKTLRDTARSVIGCDGIAIILKDGDLCHYVEEDAIGSLWKGQKFPSVACVSGWSMMNRATAVIPDIGQDDRIPYELYAGTFVRAMAMAPIRMENPVGAIGAYWSQPYTPADWEVEVLEALGEATATAFENAAFVESVNSSRMPAKNEVETLAGEFAHDIERISGIAAVPTMLDVVLRMTGMGFAAVARVTENRWVACQVLDPVGFGLKPGDELPLESTLCNEIRGHRQTIVFDDAVEDSQYRDHHTPRIYGLRSYISEPIILENGAFWGTLCAIDPNPAKVKNPEVMGAFKLFAELIAHHLDAGTRLEITRAALEQERELSELREQFIAVLGHDLRNPIAAVDAGTSRLLKEGWTERSPVILKLMKASLSRMSGLVENVMDLARARMGSGLVLSTSLNDLAETIRHVVDEVVLANPARQINVSIEIEKAVAVDHDRIAQMVSNLVANAVTHGAEDKAVEIRAQLENDELEISVTNGGEPIEVSQIDKLFLPFRRGEGKSGTQGLGLGLYIASQIARAHGGRIDVRSDPAETCFTFRMPISTAP